MLELETFVGNHIAEVSREAAERATSANEPVRFSFNETEVVVQPGEDPAVVVARWDRDYTAAVEAYRNSQQYRDREAAREAELERKLAVVMTEPAQTEAEMREAKVPWPYTKQQLHDYIDSLVGREHDYGTSVYAMSMAATAAFNYVAHQLGATGFQSSCADMDILRCTRSINGPYMILKGEDALYPQYNLVERLEEALEEWRPWLKEEAEKKLACGQAHPNVEAHWRKLADWKAEP